MGCEAGRCKTSTPYGIFIVTPSLEGWPTKAKDAPSPHEVRLTPLDTNPVFYYLLKYPKISSKISSIFLSSFLLSSKREIFIEKTILSKIKTFSRAISRSGKAKKSDSYCDFTSIKAIFLNSEILACGSYLLAIYFHLFLNNCF